MLAMLGLLLVGGAALMAASGGSQASSHGARDAEPSSRPGQGPTARPGLRWVELESADKTTDVPMRIPGGVYSPSAPYVGSKNSSPMLRVDIGSFAVPPPGEYLLRIEARAKQRGACVDLTVAWKAQVTGGTVTQEGHSPEQVVSLDRECGTNPWEGSSFAVRSGETRSTTPLSPEWRQVGDRLYASILVKRQTEGGELDVTASRPVDSFLDLDATATILQRGV